MVLNIVVTSLRMSRKFRFAVLSGVILCPALVCAQEPLNESAAEKQPAAPEIDKRAFGVLPNYRTADGSLPFKPITAGYKMKIAVKDSFDSPLYPVAALFPWI